MRAFSLGSVLRAGTFGVLAGGAVGFLVGLLIAPEEGTRLRRRLAYRMDRLADGVGDWVGSLAAPDAEPSEVALSSAAVVADAEVEAERIRGEIDRLIRAQKHRAGSSPQG